MPLMASLWLPKAPGQNIYTDLQNGSQKWDNPYFVQAMTEEATISQVHRARLYGHQLAGRCRLTSARTRPPCCWTGPGTCPSSTGPTRSLQVGSFPLPGSEVASQNLPLVQPDLDLEILSKAPDQANALLWMGFFARHQIYDQYVDITGISPSETSGTYTSFSSGVLGSWLGKGTQVSNILPNPMPPVEGYYDTATSSRCCKNR